MHRHGLPSAGHSRFFDVQVAHLADVTMLHRRGWRASHLCYGPNRRLPGRAASHWRLCYPAMRAAVLARLVEKPISLSYHAATESRVPSCTAVNGRSTIDERGSPTM